MTAADLRFVIDRDDASDEALTAQVADLLGMPVTSSPLFAPDAELDRFRLLHVRPLFEPDRADLFDMAASIRSRVGARSVEPDLGTDFFHPDGGPPADGAPESADWTWWCWADPVADRPNHEMWALTVTGAERAWQYSVEAGRPTQGEGIVVFQPDTGVVPEHRELPADLLADARSANMVESGTPARDRLDGGGNPGHGTGTASVLASPRGVRMAGAAPRATLISIRCVRSVAVFDQSRVAQAIDHARRNGAHVISLSVGGVLSSALHVAVRRAVAANVIVLAAAGNCVGEVVWPARYAEVIAVAGINEALRPWRGSSRGPAVDVSAPAELVARASPRDGMDPLGAVSPGQGTSFAVALTAGVAALWLAHHGRDRLLGILPPGLTLQELFRALVAETARVPSGFDTRNYGAGVVDALALLAQDPAPVAARSRGREADEDDRRRELVHRVLDGGALGGAGLEAGVGAAFEDPQFAPELACAALERARAKRTLRAHVESVPPLMLSQALRRQITAGLREGRG